MTLHQLSAALAIAKDSTVRFIDDNGKHVQDLSVFDGYGLPHPQTVYCSLKQLAFLIRWQCINFDGSVNAEELQNIARIGQRNFFIVS